MTPIQTPWDLRLDIDGTSFANRAQENDEALANAMLTAPLVIWRPVAKTTTYSAVANDFVVATSGTFTVTSPAASAGRTFAVFVGPSAGVVTVSAASGSIFGPGLGAGSGSFALKANGTATLVSDGTNWEVIAGGPSPSGMTFGTQSFSWTASQFSNTPTVTHGLGFTPSAVFLTANGTGGPSLVFGQAFSIGATTFQAQAASVTGTGTYSVTFGWVALG